MESFEKLILNAFNESQLLLPIDVQGDYDTLSEAVAARGWPTEEEFKGKVMFFLYYDEIPIARYREWKPDSRDRIAFVHVGLDSDDFSILYDDYSLWNASGIRELVSNNALVMYPAMPTAEGIEELLSSRAQLTMMNAITDDTIALIRGNLTT